ncbi:MAG: hypothetical protein LBG60_00020 [Bifidobacteriaceae bacterium]|nr:hypothetical protein [Bifidobacteriaceae bacterium]
MGEVAAARIIDPDAARQGQVFRARTVPWAVYSAPEAAGVGLTEAQARDQAEDRADAVVTATVPLAMSGRFVAEHGVKAPGAVKLVADGATGRILGVHILGPSAPEMIWGAAAALELELSAADLRQIVFPHPTVSEGIREAAWSLPI